MTDKLKTLLEGILAGLVRLTWPIILLVAVFMILTALRGC